MRPSQRLTDSADERHFDYGGPVATRTPDLYRVKVKQALQNQQACSQVFDSMFDSMGQNPPDVKGMGHNGPKFARRFSSIALQLGGCIRRSRHAAGLSVEALASASGLPGVYIEAVEAGRVELTVSGLVTIAEALGLSGAILLHKRR